MTERSDAPQQRPHPDNIEVMISSLLSVVQYDMRAAAEKDLRALVEMAATPKGNDELVDALRKLVNCRVNDAKGVFTGEFINARIDANRVLERFEQRNGE